jgi:hypothetical protein
VQIPWWLVFLAAVGVIGLITVSVLLIRRAWRRRADPLQSLADLAGQAARELRSGGELRNVVLRCYREMSARLSERQRISLRQAMTAREFERDLLATGVRDEHVHRLTRLFEGVRYGRHSVGPQEEAEAVACLEAIEREYGPKRT